MAVHRPSVTELRNAPQRISNREQLATVLAGALAAAAMVIDGSRDAASRRTALTLYATVRALEFSHNRMVRLGATWLDWQHLDVGMFCVACSRIMFCWFYHPGLLPSSYRHWITVMADMDSRLLAGLRCPLHTHHVVTTQCAFG